MEETYRANHPGADFILQDVSELTRHNLPSAEILIGSPPCQDISLANAKRDIVKGLVQVREYERLIREINPKYYVMENVPPLRPWLDQGTYPIIRTLNAADFGVPQIRRRVFAGDYQPPRPTHAENSQETLDGKRLHPWITVREALALDFENIWPQPIMASEHKTTLKRGALAEPLSYPIKATEGRNYRPLLVSERGAINPGPEAVRRTKGSRTLESAAYTVQARNPPVLAIRNSQQTDDWQPVDTPSSTIRAVVPPYLSAQVRVDGRAGYLKGGNDGTRTLDQPSFIIRTKGDSHGIFIIDDHHQHKTTKDKPRITDVTNSPAPTVDAREGGRPYLAITEEPATTIQADPRMLPRGHHARRNYPMFRRLTPNECSILQGFPKEFIWKPKTKTSHYQMIGNAVPPPVAQAIAQALPAD